MSRSILNLINNFNMNTMKRNYLRNLLYFFLITGFVSVTSCTSDDDNADINGDPIGGDILPPIELCEIMYDEGDLVLTNDPNRPVDYIVNCAVNILQRKITIEPGTVIEFSSNGNLDIQRYFDDHSGAIVAKGTAEKPIIFRDTEPIKGHWKGIRVGTNNGINEMDYVVIQDAGKDTYTHGGQGGLVLGNAGSGHGRIKLTNSKLLNNRMYGLHVSQFENITENLLTIKNNIIKDNETPVYANIFNLHFVDGSNDLTGNENNQIIVEGSPNATWHTKLDGTWFNHEVPYYFTSSVYLDSKITIEPGTVLEFAGNSKLQIGRHSGPANGTGGGLIANGTPDNPIVFTGAEKIEKYWEGINVLTNYTGNVISNAVIEYTGIVTSDPTKLYNLYAQGGSYIKIFNSEFRHSNHAECALWSYHHPSPLSYGTIEYDNITTAEGHTVYCQHSPY